MGKSDKATPVFGQELTEGQVLFGGEDTAGAPAVSMADILTLPALESCTVIGGATGLDRPVSGVNVMEVPDVWEWVSPGQVLLTTGYPLRDAGADLTDLLTKVAAAGLTGLVLKPHRYVPEPDQATRDLADTLHLPLVLLGDGTGFDVILRQAHSLFLDRRAEALARSERILAALIDLVVSGGSLADVCSDLVVEVADAAFVTSMDGRILAHATGDGTDWTEVTALSCLDRSGRFKVEAEPASVVVPGPLSRLSVPILVRGRHEGRLVVLRRDGLDTWDVHVIGQAAATAALVLTKEAAVAAVENKYRTDFLRDALTGRAGDDHEVIQHAAALGWNLNRPAHVIVAQVGWQDRHPLSAADEQSFQERFARAWERSVHATDPAAPVGGYSHEVVVIIAATPGGTPEDIHRRVTTIAKAVRGEGGGGRRPFTTGISRTITTPTDLPRAYAEATRAAAVGKRMQGIGSITHFDTLGVFRLLSLVDPTELRQFAHETLGTIADDTPDAEDLRETLRVLLEHNMNVAEASRLLHFHYNTLRYRITKLEQRLGPITTDPHRRFQVALALHVLQMKGLDADSCTAPG